MNILGLVFAVLVPPLGVLREVGPGKTFWLNVLLTLLAFVPGVVHAVWIVTRR